MKRLLVLVVVVACGSKPAPKPAEPIENVEPAAAAPAPAGPGNARVVQRGSAGGVIELQGDRGAAMEAAVKEMSSVCGNEQYTIVQEGEEAVGSQQRTAITTAWRVHYQCNR
jgi:hypothetical protein